MYSSVSDQVEATSRQLDRQEMQLRRLSGQAESVSLINQVQPVASPGSSVTTGAGPCVQQAWAAPSTAPGRTTSGAASATSSVLGRQASARVTASPLSRSRRTLQGVTSAPTRPGTLGGRARAATATVAESSGEASQLSRSPSPAHRSRLLASGHNLATGRPRALTSVAFGSTAGIASARSPLGRSGPGTASRQKLEPVGSSVNTSAANVVDGGLARVQSEKTLARSPRAGPRRDSRSPSPGTGRVSPAAPPQRSTRMCGFTGRRADNLLPGRALSPSPSEGSLPTAQRMVSAPTELAFKNAAIRTTKGQAGPTTSARINSTRHSATAPPGRGRPSSSAAIAAAAARQGSPDKGGGAPRVSDAGVVEATPRSHGSHRQRASTEGAVSSTTGPVPEEARSDSEEADDDGAGPQRRKLSAKQYQALVRCAQQVVATSAGGPPAPAASTAVLVQPAVREAQPTALPPRAAWTAPVRSGVRGAGSHHGSTTHLHSSSHIRPAEV